MSSPPPPQQPSPLSDQFNLPEPSWDIENLFDSTFDYQTYLPWSPSDFQTFESAIPATDFPVTELPVSESVAGGSSDHGSEEPSEKIRKRDPRLTCENFLAGRVPCACPELDALLEEQEEEEGGLRKKRARTVRAKAIGIVRCQVPGCEVDISELKGYHKRHRVCLRCVNATEVVLDGVAKRYCQQCGKFHILPDFDEGKRSCRRKLERHNKRRRRKPTNPRGRVARESQEDQPAEDIVSDVKAGKDDSFLSDHALDEAGESEDGRLSPLGSHLSSENIQSDSVLSFVSAGEPQTKGDKDSSKCILSSSFGDNKSSYSSVCPTGRISFKLYDWNPAEFPRRLRHQIFEWLGNMPVELEGYIRPGCIILTVFMAMPWFMWDELFEEASSFIQDFVSARESVLFGRGPMLVYLNDMIFQVLKGGTSLMNVKLELRPPKLHYVHPTCFEAGKPMEFVVCGSDLQSKFRFLVSFSGKYLEYDSCPAIPQTGMHSGIQKDRVKSSEHQLYKIYIHNTDPKLMGPAFIEVENESGLSNFIPVLIGDRHLCSEMRMIQQRSDESLCSKGLPLAAHNAPSGMCEGLALRQAAISELLLDVAWLLKEPQLEEMQTLLTSMQIQRFNCLLNFLIQNESIVILGKMLHSLKSVTDAGSLYKLDIETNDPDLRFFLKYMEIAREIVHRRSKEGRGLVLRIEGSLAEEDLSSDKCCDSEALDVPSASEDKEEMSGLTTCSSQNGSEVSPLINGEVRMKVTHQPYPTRTWKQDTSGRLFSSRITRSRPVIFVLVATAVCLGVCTVVFHPNEVGEFAVTIRRCLFGNSYSSTSALEVDEGTVTESNHFFRIWARLCS